MQHIQFVQAKNSVKTLTTFFSKENRRAFNSYNSRNAVQCGEVVYFVTSEQGKESGDTRRYTVRALNLQTGDVSKVSEFQQFANRKAAWRSLNKVVKLHIEIHAKDVSAN